VLIIPFYEFTPFPSTSMKLGLSTYALNWSFGIPGYLPEKKLGLPEFLETAARLGYQGVQIADNSPLIKLSPEERQALWKQATDLGLFVEIGARGLIEENLKLHIEIARESASPLLRIVIDGPGFEPTLEELPDLLAKAAATCGEGGIILAIENHDRFEAHQFAKWFDQVDSPWLGLCLDSVNSYGCGEGFRETIDTLLPYTVNFHLKDFRVRRQPYMLGLVIEGTPVGEGFLPVKSIMNRLKAIGKCRTAIVEHWTAPEDTVKASIEKETEWCQRSIQNLNSILK
jgi:3-oxoisoapionate decarboxylase